MQAFFNILQFNKKYISLVIPVLILVSLALGSLFSFPVLKYTVLPLSLLIVYPIMTGLELRSILSFKDAGTQLLTLIINFIGIPLLGFFISTLFFESHPYLAVGLFFIAILPTSSGMTITWTALANGNVSAAVKMTVLGLLLGALLSPLYFSLFFKTDIHVPFNAFIKLISIVIIIPLLLGQLTRHFVITKQGKTGFKKEIKAKLSSFSLFSLCCLIFVSVFLKSSYILANPKIIIAAIGPLLIFYLSAFMLTNITAKLFLSRQDAIAHVYGSSLRSLGIALVMSMNLFKDHGAEISLLIALAYIIQIQSATGYLKLLPFLGMKDRASDYKTLNRKK